MIADGKSSLESVGELREDASAAVRTKPTRDREYFDRFVEDHGDFNPFTDDGWDVLRERFREASGGRRGLRVLDVGCGTGRSRRIYADQAGRYIGIDLSRGALTVANARAGEHAWLQADALHLPIAPDSLDVVAFSSVLHHVPDMEAALTSATRVLRPGGLVFAFDPNIFHPAMLLFRHPRSPLYRPEGVSPDERPLRPGVLRKVFEHAGLVRIAQRCHLGLETGFRPVSFYSDGSGLNGSRPGVVSLSDQPGSCSRAARGASPGSSTG
jgi:SAM-dependent methyltransferase